MALVRQQRWSSVPSEVQADGAGVADVTTKRRRDRFKAPLKNIFNGGSSNSSSSHSISAKAKDRYIHAPLPPPPPPSNSDIGAIVATPPQPTPRNESLWARAVASLPADVFAALTVADCPKGVVNVDSVLHSARRARRLCAERAWTITFRGETMVLRDVADNILAWVGKFKMIGDIAIQYDPVHAALPWAGVRLLLDIALADTQNMGILLIGLEKTTCLLSRAAAYERLHLAPTRSSPQPSNSEALASSLVGLYASILTFLVWTRRYSEDGTAKRIAKNILATREIHELLDKLDHDEGEVRKESELAEKEWARFAHEDVLGVVREESSSLKEALGPKVEALFENLKEARRREMVMWLAGTSYVEHHENALQGLLEGTGEWLLKEETYRKWLESEQSCILWLHGIPGAGKTKLTSMVLERLLNPPIEEKRAVAYFYCNRNEPKRQNSEIILRTIIQQLSVRGSTGSLPRCVMAKYKERNKDGIESGPPGFKDCLSLLIELLDIRSRTTIVIDGLDEIDSKMQRQDFLQALKQIVNLSSSLVKLFVSSRDDTDITLALDSVPNLYIHAKDNKDDIERFIKQEVEKSIEQKKLLRGEVSNELRERIVEALIDKASGMFQWASLQIEYLCEMNFEFEIEENLGNLPETLEGAYAQIYTMIEEGRSATIARFALMWLMCAFGLLTPDVWCAATSRSASIVFGRKVEVDLHSLLKICHNLVVWDRQSGAMRFAHLSVREFLERNQLSAAEAHRVAAECCLAVLCNPDGDRCWGSGENSDPCEWHPFAVYCLTFWANHVQKCDDDTLMGGRLQASLNAFLGTYSSPGHAYCAWLERARQRRCSAQTSPSLLSWVTERVTSLSPNPLLAAAYFGFREKTVDCWRAEFDVNSQNACGETLLTLAASCRNRSAAIEVVNILLRHNVDLGSQAYRIRSANNPILSAIRNQNIEIVSLLINVGVQLPSLYTNILVAVAGEGDEIMTAHILSQHPSLAISESVLVHAARNGHEVMAILLDHHPSAEITESVLMEAAYNSSSTGCELLKLLLRRSSSLEVTENVLMDAARNPTNAEDVATLLLAHSPNTPITDAVLMEAAFNPGGCALMSMFLARGGQSSVRITHEIIETAENAWRAGGEGVVGEEKEKVLATMRERLRMSPPSAPLPEIPYAFPDSPTLGPATAVLAAESPSPAACTLQEDIPTQEL